MKNLIIPEINAEFKKEDFNPSKMESKIPKNVLIDFLKTTNNPEIKLFEFSLIGDKNFAKTFIHNMRNELSRLRKKAIDQRRTPTRFKIILINIYCSIDERICNVSLERRTEKVILPELDDVLDTFCTEEDKSE